MSTTTTTTTTQDQQQQDQAITAAPLSVKDCRKIPYRYQILQLRNLLDAMGAISPHGTPGDYVKIKKDEHLDIADIDDARALAARLEEGIRVRLGDAVALLAVLSYDEKGETNLAGVRVANTGNGAGLLATTRILAATMTAKKDKGKVQVRR